MRLWRTYRMAEGGQGLWVRGRRRSEASALNLFMHTLPVVKCCQQPRRHSHPQLQLQVRQQKQDTHAYTSSCNNRMQGGWVQRG